MDGECKQDLISTFISLISYATVDFEVLLAQLVKVQQVGLWWQGRSGPAFVSPKPFVDFLRGLGFRRTLDESKRASHLQGKR